MNEKQVKLTEFMIAFEKKSHLILISASAVKVTFMKKHPEASVLNQACISVKYAQVLVSVELY